MTPGESERNVWVSNGGGQSWEEILRVNYTGIYLGTVLISRAGGGGRNSVQSLLPARVVGMFGLTRRGRGDLIYLNWNREALNCTAKGLTVAVTRCNV